MHWSYWTLALSHVMMGQMWDGGYHTNFLHSFIFPISQNCLYINYLFNIKHISDVRWENTKCLTENFAKLQIYKMKKNDQGSSSNAHIWAGIDTIQSPTLMFQVHFSLVLAYLQVSTPSSNGLIFQVNLSPQDRHQCLRHQFGRWDNKQYDI